MSCIRRRGSWLWGSPRLLIQGGSIIDGNKVITSLIPLGDIVEKGFETLANDRKQCKILVDMHLT